MMRTCPLEVVLRSTSVPWCAAYLTERSLQLQLVLLILERAQVPPLLGPLLVHEAGVHLPLVSDELGLVHAPLLLPPVLHDHPLLLAVRHATTLAHGRLRYMQTSPLSKTLTSLTT